MKKKIIFVHSALWVGGIETALISILNKIDYNKYDVTCLILSNHREFERRVPEKCKLIIADRRSTVSFKNDYKYGSLFSLFEKPQTASKARLFIWRVLQFFLRPVDEVLYGKYIKENLGDEVFDVAVFFSSGICGVGVKAVNFKKCLCFYHYSDLRRVYHDGKGYKKCEKIFAVSENITEKLKEFMPEYKNKLAALHNITDAESIRLRSEEKCCIAFENGVTNVVSCARLHTDKGFDMAIEACRILNEKGCEFKWYVIGTGPEEEKLLKLARQKKVDNFVFLGQHINPYPIIKQADFFVQPSKIEAFGLTITESLVLGVPVVSTKTDGGKELIKDGKTGLLCDISAQAIANSMEKLLTDKALLAELKENVSKINFKAENEKIMQTLYGAFE